MNEMTIVLRLDPQALENPDLDIRYVLPDLLTERSGGLITEDGYDYDKTGRYLFLFLQADSPEMAIPQVLRVIKNEEVLENDLKRGVVVAAKRGSEYEVLYPDGFEGPFSP